MRDTPNSNLPPPHLLDALRRPRMTLRFDLMSPGRERVYFARLAEVDAAETTHLVQFIGELETTHLGDAIEGELPDGAVLLW